MPCLITSLTEEKRNKGKKAWNKGAVHVWMYKKKHKMNNINC